MTEQSQPEKAAPPTFDVLPLSPEIRKAIDALGYTSPTPVQVSVYEPATRGKSLVVQARTGTGKTAAFGLPLVDVLVKKTSPHVQALVLTPTRELALQVARELEALSQFRQLKIVPIYGGAPMGKQVEALEGGAQIVVGTPGRVLDHLRRTTFDPSHVKMLVLDEADEMLSMGFAKELHAIVEFLPKERQGLYFSATLPPDMERLAASHLKDPEWITLSSDSVGALSIQHYVYMWRSGDKRQELVRIIEVENPESAVVFCNTKDETERMCEALQNKGYDAEWLNGDLDQKERERIMAKTREGKLRFLVATDVAARGIDISHLTHVINADFPESAEAYVHRTGRTGRAGRTGTAISIVGPKDVGNIYLLRLTYKIRPLERQLPTAGELKTRAEQDLISFFVEAFGSRVPHADDLALARRLLTHVDAERILASLLRDHLGARPNAEAEAAEARRSKNPAPIPDVPARMGTPTHRPKRMKRDEPSGGAKRVPHTAFATWEPTEESDDDAPILGRDAAAPTKRVPEPVMPNITISDVPLGPNSPRAASAFANREPRVHTDLPGHVQLFVNVGKRDGAKPQDLQKLLTDRAGISRDDTGPIRVRDRNTFVSVKKEDAERAIQALSGEVVGGRTVSAELAKPRDEKPRATSDRAD